MNFHIKNFMFLNFVDNINEWPTESHWYLAFNVTKYNNDEMILDHDYGDYAPWAMNYELVVHEINNIHNSQTIEISIQIINKSL